MFFNLAQAATTVIETVTVTPPSFKLEIVNQKSGWTAKDVTPVALSILALGVSIFTFIRQGAIAVFQATVSGSRITPANQAMVRVSLLNKGRMPGRILSADVHRRTDSFLPILDGDFPRFWDDESKELTPGDIFIGDISLRELVDLAESDRDTLRDFYFVSWMNGKTLKTKIPRKEARKWHLTFNQMVKDHLRESVDLESKVDEYLGDYVLGDDLLGDAPPSQLITGTRWQRIKIWFLTLK